MITAQPKTRAKDAIALIDAHMRAGDDAPDEITVMRLRRALMESMVADAAEAYAGLGMLETLLWHADDARNHFNKAVQLDSEFTVHSNYAMCLARLGKISDAAEHARIAAAMALTDIHAIERATHYSMVAGELGAAKDWAEKLRKLTPGSEPREASAVDSILSVFAKSGVHESVMAQCNKLAYSVAGAHQTVIAAISSEVDLQDKIVLLTLTLNASEKKTQELDSILGSQLFEQVPNYDPGKYWVGFAAGRQT